MAYCLDRALGMLTRCPFHNTDGGGCDDPRRARIPTSTPCSRLDPSAYTSPIGAPPISERERVRQAHEEIVKEGFDPWAIPAFRLMVWFAREELIAAHRVDRRQRARVLGTDFQIFRRPSLLRHPLRDLAMRDLGTSHEGENARPPMPPTSPKE